MNTVENEDTAKIIDDILKNNSLLEEYCVNKRQINALVRALKASPDPDAKEKIETLLLKGSYSHDVTVVVHDYFVKQRKQDMADQVLPAVLEATSRKESIFKKLDDNLKLLETEAAEIQMTDGDLWNAGRVLKRSPRFLLRLPQVRSYLSKRRRRELVQDLFNIEAKDGTYSIDNTVVHNLETMDTGADDGRRSELLLFPLISIDDVRKRAAQMKLLAIGPRSESELYSIYSVGFDPENVTGLDLISYTPLISQGDMHDLPFENNSFDVVMAGWVLAYSTNNELAASEILRVAKSGAYLAIGCVYIPADSPEHGEIVGTDIDPTRFSCVEDILKLFDGKIDKVFFYGEPAVAADRSAGNKQITVVFRVK